MIIEVLSELLGFIMSIPTMVFWIIDNFESLLDQKIAEAKAKAENAPVEFYATWRTPIQLWLNTMQI